MLQSLLIMSSSGLLLFHKVFGRAQEMKTAFLGGVVTAILKMSAHKTGLTASYIELTKVGVAMASNSKASVALFVDIEDGMEFAKLLAREILDAFTTMYMTELDEKLNTPDTFGAFNGKVVEVIANAVRPVLDNLQDQRGIKLALLISGDTMRHFTQEVDKLSVLANHQALLNAVTDLLNANGDTPMSITLKAKTTSLVLHRIERTSLVVVYKNAVDESICLEAINKTVKMLRKLLAIVPG